MPDTSVADLATLAHLASQGNLDLTAVTMRVRTDLITASKKIDPVEMRSYLDFSLAVLPRLGDRDLSIIVQKLADWPATPLMLRQALVARLPGAEAIFEKAEASRLAQPLFAPHEEDADAFESPMEPALMQVDATADENRAPLTAATDEGSAAASAEATTLPSTMSQAHAATAEAAALSRSEDNSATLIERARALAARGDTALSASLFEQSELGQSGFGMAELAPLFLAGNDVQQQRILDNLRTLERLWPPHRPAITERAPLDHVIDLALTDPAGAFLGLADLVGGTPEFAAMLTLDMSRKLTGLAFLATGGSEEDAVRFAIRLGDDSSRSIAVVFAMVETLRLATPGTAMRILRAVAGAQIRAPDVRMGRHVPAADPSGTPQRSQTGRQRPSVRDLVAQYRNHG